MDDKKSRTSAEVKNRYRDKVYDRVEIIVPKGQRDKLKAAADAQGKSLNQYISAAIKMYERVSGSQ